MTRPMIDIEAIGFGEIAWVLDNIAPREAFNVMRATVHGVAGIIKKTAVDIYMPVNEGVMKKATKVKRDRADMMRGLMSSSIIVGNDAFYWRFIEYGDGPDGIEYAMFHKAVADFEANKERIIKEQFKKKYIANLERAMRRAARRGR